MMKEAGKFFIRDLEQTIQDKEDEKAKKRRRADVEGYGDGDEVDSDLEEEEKIGNLHRRLKEVRQRKPVSNDANKFKAVNPVTVKKRDLKG